MKELDTRYQVLRKKFEEHMQLKLIQESGKIELFHDTYQHLVVLIDTNSAINNRSLF